MEFAVSSPFPPALFTMNLFLIYYSAKASGPLILIRIKKNNKNMKLWPTTCFKAANVLARGGFI